MQGLMGYAGLAVSLLVLGSCSAGLTSGVDGDDVVAPVAEETGSGENQPGSGGDQPGSSGNQPNQPNQPNQGGGQPGEETPVTPTTPTTSDEETDEEGEEEEGETEEKEGPKAGPLNPYGSGTRPPAYNNVRVAAVELYSDVDFWQEKLECLEPGGSACRVDQTFPKPSACFNRNTEFGLMHNTDSAVGTPFSAPPQHEIARHTYLGERIVSGGRLASVALLRTNTKWQDFVIVVRLLGDLGTSGNVSWGLHWREDITLDSGTGRTHSTDRVVGGSAGHRLVNIPNRATMVWLDSDDGWDDGDSWYSGRKISKGPDGVSSNGAWHVVIIPARHINDRNFYYQLRREAMVGVYPNSSLHADYTLPDGSKVPTVAVSDAPMRFTAQPFDGSADGQRSKPSYFYSIRLNPDTATSGVCP